MLVWKLELVLSTLMRVPARARCDVCGVSEAVGRLLNAVSLGPVGPVGVPARRRKRGGGGGATAAASTSTAGEETAADGLHVRPFWRYEVPAVRYLLQRQV